jgi:peptide/nickel transport system permease protein
MFRLLPGDPATAMLPPGISESDRQQLLESWGLTKPLHIQYVLYMKNLLMGDLGVSFASYEPVTEIVVDRTLNTIVLMIPAVIIAYIIGPLIGSILAWYRGTKIDTAGIGLILIARGAPLFWTGMLGIMFFSFQLGLVPSGGMTSPGTTYNGFLDKILTIDFLHHLILPLSVITLYLLSVPAFLMRNTMIDNLDADFIDLLRAEGLSELRIVYLHGARNSLLPVVHRAGIVAGAVFGGSVVIETVFSWPGVGQTMYTALNSRNFPLVQGTFLVVALMIIVMNFLADIMSVYVDPRTSVADER